MAITLRILENIENPMTSAWGSAFYYNGFVYLVGDNSIYKFDRINNIYTLLLQFPSNHTAYAAIYGSYIYIVQSYNINGNLIISRYDIDTNIFEESFVTTPTIVTPSGSNARYSLPTIIRHGSSFLIVYCLSTNSYSNNKKYYAIVFNMETNTTDYYVNNDDSNSISYNCPARNISDIMYISGYTHVTYGMGSNPDKTYYSRGNTYSIAEDLHTVTKFTPSWGGYFRSQQIQFASKCYLIGGQYFNGSSTEETPPSHFGIDVYDPALNTMTRDAFTIRESEDPTYTFAVIIENKLYIFFQQCIYILENVTYDNVYSIKSNDEQTTYVELTDQEPILTMRFNYDPDTNTAGYVFEEISQTVSGNFTLQEGRTLAGFSRTPNANLPDYPLNTTIDFPWNSNLTLYPVFTDIRFDLTTLDLEPGSYEIKVKAKNLRTSSNFSNAIEYIVEE